MPTKSKIKKTDKNAKIPTTNQIKSKFQMRKTLAILIVFLCCSCSDTKDNHHAIFKQAMEFLKDGDPESASTLLEIACNKGNSWSCGMLGGLYLKGEGVPKDIEKAKDLSGRACNMGNPMVCEKAGNIYRAEKNYEQARIFYEKGCTKGDDESCYSLAYMCNKGLGGKQDVQKSISIWSETCDKNHAGSCLSLGFVYSNDLGQATKGRPFYKKACDLGEKLACLALQR